MRQSTSFRRASLFLGIAGIVIVALGAAAAPSDDIAFSRESAIVRAVERASPAVVNISSTQIERVPVLRFFDWYGGNPFGFEERRSQSLGSGVIFDAKKGYVLTNEHVVQDADEITVRLHDGRRFDAKVVGSDRFFDLAVLQIRGDDLPEAVFGDSNALRIGEWAIAIGNPFGVYVRDLEPSVTVGVISAMNRVVRVDGRTYANLIQTDASVNPGNSGGPLVNAAGEVIGINTFILTESGGSHGVNFALAINIARRVIDHLVQHGEVEEPWLGLTYADLTVQRAAEMKLKVRGGVLVTYVRQESAAGRAGIQAGDVLVEIDGQPIYFQREARGILRLAEAGEAIDVRFVRKGKTRTATIRVDRRPKDFSFFGVIVEEPRRGRGLVVTDVEKRSLFDRVLRPGDVLVQIERVRIRSLAQLREISFQVQPDEKYRLFFVRGRESLYVDFTLP